MSVSVSVKDITKLYKLYNRPSHRLREIFLKKRFHKEFIALDNISFELAEGESIGIIGENGAGKTTLLKILAKTLSPTSGTVVINGKVSSLLELGSGFHPEFTGMENIYFYGALMGLNKNDLSKKIDEILEFAEIGDFIHYPLKTYSSGMYVRLAFSVATAINPDVLVVDEALSVGDIYFQKKSINKILSFKEQGKTIVFCSHAIYYINQLCKKVLWLKNGKSEMFGHHYEVTQAYEKYQLEKTSDKRYSEEREGGIDVTVKSILIEQVQTAPFPNLKTGDDLRVNITVISRNDSYPYKVAAIIKRIDELDVTSTYSKDLELLKGDHQIGLEFPSIQLKAGAYFVRVYILDEHMLHIYDTKDSLQFHIPKEEIEVGLVELPCRWVLKQ